MNKYSGADWLTDLDWDEIYENESDLWSWEDNLSEKSCDHEWVWYEGIIERYYFCEKCDEKTDKI